MSRFEKKVLSKPEVLVEILNLSNAEKRLNEVKDRLLLCDDPEMAKCAMDLLEATVFIKRTKQYLQEVSK